jgi:hypothetical protein
MFSHATICLMKLGKSFRIMISGRKEDELTGAMSESIKFAPVAPPVSSGPATVTCDFPSTSIP